MITLVLGIVIGVVAALQGPRLVSLVVSKVKAKIASL